MLVLHASTVLNAGIVRSPPASIRTSRARLLYSRFGITVPQIRTSGRTAPAANITRSTGTESAIALCCASAPSALANGVRLPAASQSERAAVAFIGG